LEQVVLRVGFERRSLPGLHMLLQACLVKCWLLALVEKQLAALNEEKFTRYEYKRTRHNIRQNSEKDTN